MASAQAKGSGPGWQGACVLATALLWLRPLLLRAEPNGTTADVCGKPAVSGKIFGGQNAPDQRWPWQASLLYLGKHICGAALIDAYWVISAAHCFQNEFNKRYFMGSDIALLQLHLSVNFTSHILPACLPGPTTKLPIHSSCWITGWGMITEDDFLASPLQLQEGEVGIVDSEICKIYFQSPDSSSSEYSIHEDMFCAGDLMTGKSICRGDSGGPLVCKLNSSTWFLMGLSSWSLACRYPISPSVFTRLTYFSSWISEKQKNSPNPEPSFAPPQEKPPILSDFTSLGTVHKPSTCITLVSSQTSLLLLISLRTL
ncbi:serine protease 40 isoform X2 [Callorhinus ursinus]|uniref:Serine protease 40 isoform X3 n=2 Tax=Otariidae TaxID=9702 RepID=A0A3Q7MVI5_CALUR|nr:serine protease 40 isoform X3 [Callorhinus ursinus]XP_027446637.1 serine protease 40 isoform X2 [Zalophus californianus]